MPEFSPATPTKAHTFAGVTVNLPHVYAEGHVLLPNEAAFLNQMVASTVGNYYNNTVRAELKRLNDEATTKFTTKHAAWVEAGSTGKEPKAPTPLTVADLQWDHQTLALERFAAFTPGVSTRTPGEGKTSTDPIAHAARNIAVTKVKEAILAKGLKIKDFYATKDAEGKSAFDKQVGIYLDRNPWVQELAKAQIEALKSNEGVLEGLEL